MRRRGGGRGGRGGAIACGINIIHESSATLAPEKLAPVAMLAAPSGRHLPPLAYLLAMPGE
eukprot:1068396-Pyramimonas_sp.AAC.1